MNKKIVLGLMAHVDSGKTSLAEQLLFQTNNIQRCGRVDHRDAFLDSHDIERERGITVFADQAVMPYNDATYYLIDTPGHVDFSPEMERAMQVMDYAILVISAVEGVEGHTETVWQLLRRHKVPTFIFINKIDRTGADVERVMAEIRAELTADACLIRETDDPAQGRMGEALIEAIAERDDHLLETYMEWGYQAEPWRQQLIEQIAAQRLIPCLAGSALHNVGVTHLLQQLDGLTRSAYVEEGAFSGRVYKIRHDEQGARLTYVKALSGSLQVRDEIGYVCNGEQCEEKVTQIRMVNGTRMKAVERVKAGDLFVVTGLTGAVTGQGIGATDDHAVYELVPTLKSKVHYDAALHPKEVWKAFQLLDAEDPSLHAVWEEATQAIHIQVMGLIQLEVLQRIVKERFGYQVAFGDPEILYKETITSAVVGSGHFEPLKHYAEVHLRLEPAPRDSGITYNNECHPDMLTTNYQNLVAQHVGERDHHGILTGSPVTDVKITLVKGKAHNKHTHGGDFREATFRALRQGLEKAECLLLEPYYDFKIRVELDHLGRVMSDITQASGRFAPPETLGTKVLLTGRVPVATFMNYSVELAAYTQGRGMISLTYGGYERCHNEAEVIERKGYNKDADPEYTSSSIFCAKGSGYAVPWDEADAYMHV